MSSRRAVALANSFGARGRAGRSDIRGGFIAVDDGMTARAEKPRDGGFAGTGIAPVAFDARGLITVDVVIADGCNGGLRRAIARADVVANDDCLARTRAGTSSIDSNCGSIFAFFIARDVVAGVDADADASAASDKIANLRFFGGGSDSTGPT